MIELYIAYAVLGIVWIGGSYLMGSDPTHIFEDGNHWEHRIFRGVIFQLVMLLVFMVISLVIWSIVTVIGSV